MQFSQILFRTRMLAEVWTEGEKARLSKAAKNWASAPEVSRPEGALLHNWFCLDTFLKVRHNWHNKCTDFLKIETCSLILRKSRTTLEAQIDPEANNRLRACSFWSQLCSPLCLSSFSDSLFSHGGKRTTTQYKLLLHNSKTTTSSRGPEPDSQNQIGPQAQPWTNQCPGRWNTLIGSGLGHTPLLELVMGSP